MPSLITVSRRCGTRLLALAPSGLLKFLAVGMVGLAVHTGIFTVTFHFGLDRSLAWFAGFCAATLTTWSLNRKHTFAVTGRRRSEEMARYALVTAVAQSVSFVVFHTACEAFPHAPPPLFVIVGAMVATVFSYSGQRFFTFSPAQRRPEPVTHVL